MRQYLFPLEAQEFLAVNRTIKYPDQAINLLEYPLIPSKFDPSQDKEIPTVEPSPLIVEAASYFGHEPKRIIDIGSAAGKNALYLAYNGHYVTAMDSEKKDVDWSMDRAQFLGIPRKNFTAFHGDLNDITSDDKYEGVVSTMTLHFLDEPYSSKALKVFRDMTVGEGINVLSVYTEDNPKEEITLRGLKRFFRARELANSFTSGWRLIRDEEGYSPKTLGRHLFLNENKVLIPTIAEVIARKGEDFASKVRRITGRDIGYWSKADPEYLDTLALVHS